MKIGLMSRSVVGTAGVMTLTIDSKSSTNIFSILRSGWIGVTPAQDGWKRFQIEDRFPRNGYHHSGRHNSLTAIVYGGNFREEKMSSSTVPAAGYDADRESMDKVFMTEPSDS